MDNFKQVLSNYMIRHVQAACNSLGQLARAPLTTFFTCLVIGITIALPSLLYVGLKNAEAMRGNFQQTTQVTLYLKNSATEYDARSLARTLQQKPNIAKTAVISPEEGLRELQQNAGFQGVLEELTDNPLPWAIIVNPKIANDNTHALDQFAQTLKQLPQVESVQADMLWVKRFSTFITLIKRSVISLAIFLGAAVLLIVNNAIRSATQRSQKEIEVIKLIGGTNAFIRRPFLYAGIFYGLLGSAIAALLVDFLMIAIRSPASRFAALYNSNFALLGLGGTGILALLASGMILGLTGAWVAVKAARTI